MTKTSRLWELDALRGVMILMVVFIHLCFDLDYFLGIDLIKNPVLHIKKSGPRIDRLASYLADPCSIARGSLGCCSFCIKSC